MQAEAVKTVPVLNLAQLKKALKVGTRFQVLAHQKSGYLAMYEK